MSTSQCQDFNPTRRHLFACGCLASAIFSVFNWSQHQIILTLSILLVIYVVFTLLNHNVDEEIFYSRQRRWFFLSGLSLSTYYLQRFGLLAHGSSYYLQHAPQLKLARDFRNLVFSRNYQNARLPESDLVKSFLPPTDAMLMAGQHIEQSFGAETNDTTFLNDLSQYFIRSSQLTPSAMHANSLATPFVDVKSKYERRRGGGNGRAGKEDRSDVILIVFNGILGEFIASGPFESMFYQNSTFEDNWKNKIEEISTTNHQIRRKLAHDEVWSLDTLSTKKISMNKLFEATSVDLVDISDEAVEEGRSKVPEFRVLRFRPPFGSMESIGTLASSAGHWLRRMVKIHTILTTEMLLSPKYVFVGYSRGALLALDVLARGKRRIDAHPWITNVVGCVAVGGPLFGAEGADFAHLPGHIFYDLLEPIRGFARRLDYGHEGDAGSVGHAKEIFQNSWEFLKLGWELSKVNNNQKKSDRAKNADDLFQKECGEFGVPLPSMNVVTDGLVKLLFHKFDLLSPISRYYHNIKALKIMAGKMLDGVTDLTTTARLEWWHNSDNHIPKHVALFAIPATMPGAGQSVESLDQSIHFSSSSKSSDWWTNRLFYYATFGDTGGKQCQDGQVSCDRAIFWTEMLRRCGWDMTGRETGILAVVGSHHWGLALPRALDDVSSKLPRGALLDGIGALFAKRERENDVGFFEL